MMTTGAFSRRHMQMMDAISDVLGSLGITLAKASQPKL